MSKLCDTAEGAKEIANNLDTDQEKAVSQISTCAIELLMEADSARKQAKKNSLFSTIDANEVKGTGADLILERDSQGNILLFEVHGSDKK